MSGIKLYYNLDSHNILLTEAKLEFLLATVLCILV